MQSVRRSAFQIEKLNLWQNFLNRPLPFSERRLLLILFDSFAINISIYLALILRPQLHFDWLIFLNYPLWFILLSLIWFTVAYAYDVYNPQVIGNFSKSVRATIKASSLSVLIYLLIPFVTPSLPTSRILLLAFFGLTITLLTLGRGVYALTLGKPLFQDKILIIGTGESGRHIAQTVTQHGNGLYQVVGFVDDNLDEPKIIADCVKMPRAIPCSLYDLQDRITTLVIATPREVNQELFNFVEDCIEQGIQVVQMSGIYEEITNRVPVEHIGNSWKTAVALSTPHSNVIYTIANRLFDVLVGLLGLIFLIILLPVIALAIYLDSPGPIFYSQERVGQGGRKFFIHKFRSMIPNAENGQAQWAKQRDSRITRIGRILRATRLDEIPQFWNILKGEMSLIGPRPERPEFVKYLVDRVPLYRIRHAVKPGLTGWAQVQYRYGDSVNDALIKLQYDLYYIKHRGFFLDMLIILKTVQVILGFKGR